MRAIAFAMLLASTSAYADSFVGASGGLMVPLGDSKSDNSGWSDQVSSSPMVGIRAGALGESHVGGMLTADWTPLSYNFNNQITDVSAHRFRILAQLMFEQRVAPKLDVELRAGGGIDIIHASADATILGTNFHASDTNVGWAAEIGGGAFFALGDVDVGGELAFPFAGHSHKANGNGEITFDYTSYDVDFLFVVRLRSK